MLAKVKNIKLYQSATLNGFTDIVPESLSKQIGTIINVKPSNSRNGWYSYDAYNSFFQLHPDWLDFNYDSKDTKTIK